MSAKSDAELLNMSAGLNCFIKCFGWVNGKVGENSCGASHQTAGKRKRPISWCSYFLSPVLSVWCVLVCQGCVWGCAGVCVCLCKQTMVYKVLAHAHIYTHVHTYIHVFIHVDIRICTYIYTRSHTHTPTHTSHGHRPTEVIGKCSLRLLITRHNRVGSRPAVCDSKSGPSCVCVCVCVCVCMWRELYLPDFLQVTVARAVRLWFAIKPTDISIKTSYIKLPL